jgi:ankyrin repeat protein
LPNLSTEWRQYRPSGTNQIKDRFAQIKRARANQVSKYLRRQARFAVDFKVADAGTDKIKATHSQTTPFYDPCRHYNENLPPGVPSHYFLPQSGLWYSAQSSLVQRQQTLTEALDDCRWSDKEVVADWPTLPDILDGSHYIDLEADPAIPSLASGESSQGLVNTGEATTVADELLRLELRNSVASRALRPDTDSSQIRGLKRTRSQLSSIGSLSARSLRDSISSRLSPSLSYIEAVLSSSNSLRSSLVYALSIASDRISKSSEVSLSRDEYFSWNELVDDSIFSSTSIQHPQTSLYCRPCCQFFEKDTYKRTLCDVCGFSEMHQLARCSLSDDSELIDSFRLDRFGNTPLHHAAAAGNTVRVTQLMSSPVGQLHARNASGETCLHVLRLEGGDLFPEYLEILRKASSFGFQFSIRDYNGITAADKLDELRAGWEVDQSRMREATKILFPGDLEDVPIPTNPLEVPTSPGISTFIQAKKHKKQGFGLNRLRSRLASPKLRWAQEAEAKYKLDSNGDTMLISALKNWPQMPKSRAQLENLISQSDIHMRDRRGYTALAIAARQGLREATSLLLQHGANPNTRSNQETGIVAHATASLAQAQKEGKDLLYARILSCLTLLIDHGGKAVVTVYDEYTLPGRSPNKGKQLFGRRPSIRRLNIPRHTVEEDPDEDDDDFRALPAELADTCMQLPAEMPAVEPVGSELYAPTEVWPLPLSPLPLLFAMSELRDEKAADRNSVMDDSHHRPKKRQLDSGKVFTPLRDYEIRGPVPSGYVVASRPSEDPNKNSKKFSNRAYFELRTSEDMGYEQEPAKTLPPRGWLQPHLSDLQQQPDPRRPRFSIRLPRQKSSPPAPSWQPSVRYA